MERKGTILVIVALVISVCMAMAIVYAAEPTAPTSLTRGADSSKAADSAATTAAQGGNITNVNLTENQQTGNWQGYWGNVTTAAVTLDDASGNTFYDWSMVSTTGEVFATRASSVTWASVTCASASTYMQTEETALGIADATLLDGVNETYNNTYDDLTGFYVAGVHINKTDSCPRTNAYTNGASVETNWYQLLLYDSSSVIYTTLIQSGGAADYKNNPADFQLLVGANSTVLTYYFWIELG